MSGGRADEDGESTGQLGSDREGRGLKRRSLDEGTTRPQRGTEKLSARRGVRAQRGVSIARWSGGF